ncbi:MAG: outer membrane lipoprotein carrier protein LolA [Nitrospirae bacterium]|nr:outer membrane lipoprotein carrier protein LolA [Nitrospirota bacterium]
MNKSQLLYRFPTICLVLILGSLAALSPAVSLGAGTDDAVVRIQRAYEDIKDMKGVFVQKNVIKDLNKTDTYTGDFFVKRPLRMKWAYKGKASQDLLINNDTVLIYKKGDNQAYRSKFNKETYGQSPVVLLTGMGNIREEFVVTGTEKVLTLKPKKPMAGIISITLHLSDTGFPIRSFTIRDGRNTVEIELNDVRINTGIKDSLFDLHLPKEVNVFEQPS